MDRGREEEEERGRGKEEEGGRKQEVKEVVLENNIQTNMTMNLSSGTDPASASSSCD